MEHFDGYARLLAFFKSRGYDKASDKLIEKADKASDKLREKANDMVEAVEEGKACKEFRS